MKQIALLCCSILLLAGCKKEEQTPENSGTLCFEPVFINSGIADNFLSVFFLTAKTGFVAGYQGGVYKTTDSAKTWSMQHIGTSLPVRSIFFTSATTGFAAGGENSCGGTGCIPGGGFILRTTDGGNSWTRVFTPTEKVAITSVYFTDAATGFCTGDNYFFKTTDGGSTWTELKISNAGGSLMKVFFTDSQNGYIASISGKILRTGNGGNSWEMTDPGTRSGFYAITASGGVSYAAGQGSIVKLAAGTNIWATLPNSPKDIFDLYFPTANTGYAFGRGNYSGGDFGHYYGALYCTSNGGASWHGNADFKQVQEVTAVSFPSKNTGYAISRNMLVKIEIR